MVSNLYLLALLASVGNLVYLSQKKNRGVDRYVWTILILIPIIILGYWLKTTIHSVEAAMVCFCFIYLESSVFVVVCLFAVLNSIRAKIPGWVKFGIYGAAVFHLLTIWLSKDNNLYYASMHLVDTGMGIATHMTDGPIKFTHYIFLGSIGIAIVVALIVGLIRNETYSKKSLITYTVTVMSGIVVYAYELFFNMHFSMLPGFYALFSIFLTFRIENIQSHSIHLLIGERQSKHGRRGFAAFDKKKQLLGYNSQFAETFPDIQKIIIDTKFSDKYKYMADLFYPLIDRCVEQGNFSDYLNYQDKIFNIAVSSFSVNNGSRKNGFIIEFADVTEEKKRVELIEQFNERLGKEVKEKTDHILDIQNSVVLGLANLVENRDENTGGHIKRTSAIIKILVDEALRRKTYEFDEVHAHNIVRAAPMHDLGKMHIESAILCKPGKLNDEEYAVMKTHAPKSGEMVRIILDEVEEPHFVNTAYNIARYHHERWDGRGYPEGLMGDAIPMEARIMAVADVYDALVSKRCYKEPMSFDVARKIMNENMGTQFDPAMRPVFNSCIDQLEAYYAKDREEQ